MADDASLFAQSANDTGDGVERAVLLLHDHLCGAKSKRRRRQTKTLAHTLLHMLKIAIGVAFLQVGVWVVAVWLLPCRSVRHAIARLRLSHTLCRMSREARSRSNGTDVDLGLDLLHERLPPIELRLFYAEPA